jgi:hypothetical protein
MAQINKPSDYFNTKLYTGNATNPTTISGIGFQPDWVWTKLRAGGTEGHRLCDSVRGATKDLLTNTTSAELTNTIGLKSFNSDGYVIGNSNGYNFNSATFVSWNWLASNGTASNTDGSITSTVSANTTSGFSIVSYTGTGSNATIGHGIDTPKMIIVKNISVTKNWCVYHHSIGNAKIMKLNETDAETANTTTFNSTSPNSSVFTVGTSSLTNSSGENFIAYCFAEKKGFSKFGSYTGNGNADGPFIYTGFKPAFVIIKMSGAVGNWVMLDNKRSDVPNANVNDQVLYANASDAELSSATRAIDTLSNGFKVRGSGGNINTSGGAYIYMAFAENPLVGTNNIPATAR